MLSFGLAVAFRSKWAMCCSKKTNFYRLSMKQLAHVKGGALPGFQVDRSHTRRNRIEGSIMKIRCYS